MDFSSACLILSVPTTCTYQEAEKAYGLAMSHLVSSSFNPSVVERMIDRTEEAWQIIKSELSKESHQLSNTEKPPNLDFQEPSNYPSYITDEPVPLVVAIPVKTQIPVSVTTTTPNIPASSKPTNDRPSVLAKMTAIISVLVSGFMAGMLVWPLLLFIAFSNFANSVGESDTYDSTTSGHVTTNVTTSTTGLSITDILIPLFPTLCIVVGSLCLANDIRIRLVGVTGAVATAILMIGYTVIKNRDAGWLFFVALLLLLVYLAVSIAATRKTLAQK